MVLQIDKCLFYDQVSAVCPVCFVSGGVRAACKTKSRFTGRGSPRYENYRTKVGKKALAATFLRFWGINNLVSALSAGAAGPIRCRAGFSRRRPEFGIVCYPCPRTFRPGKVPGFHKCKTIHQARVTHQFQAQFRWINHGFLFVKQLIDRLSQSIYGGVRNRLLPALWPGYEEEQDVPGEGSQRQAEPAGQKPGRHHTLRRHAGGNDGPHVQRF